MAPTSRTAQFSISENRHYSPTRFTHRNKAYQLCLVVILLLATCTNKVNAQGKPGAGALGSQVAVTLLDRPPALSTSSNATFGFMLTDRAGQHADCPSCSWTCTLDGGPPAPCNMGSQMYGGLEDGPHSFLVKVTGISGQNNSATHSWIVNTGGPEATITISPVPFNASSATVRVSFSEACLHFTCTSAAACGVQVRGPAEVLPGSFRELEAGRQYVVVVNFTAEAGRLAVRVPRGACVDSEGSASLPSGGPAALFRFNRRPMVAEIATLVEPRAANVTGRMQAVLGASDSSSLAFVLRFSMPAGNTTEEIRSALLVTGGALSNFTNATTNMRKFTFQVSPAKEQTPVQVQLLPGAVRNKYNAPSSEAVSPAVLFDSRPLTVKIFLTEQTPRDTHLSSGNSTITTTATNSSSAVSSRRTSITSSSSGNSGSSGSSNSSVIRLRATFSAPVTKFQQSMLSLSGASLLEFEAAGPSVYDFSVAVDDEKEGGATAAIISVGGDVTTNLVGTPNVASNVLHIENYKVPAVSKALSAVVTVGMATTAATSGALTLLMTAASLASGASAPPVAAGRNLLGMAGHVQMIALLDWVAAPLSPVLKGTTHRLRWMVPSLSLPWEDATSPSVSWRSKGNPGLPPPKFQVIDRAGDTVKAADGADPARQRSLMWTPGGSAADSSVAAAAGSVRILGLAGLVSRSQRAAARVASAHPDAEESTWGASAQAAALRGRLQSGRNVWGMKRTVQGMEEQEEEQQQEQEEEKQDKQEKQGKQEQQGQEEQEQQEQQHEEEEEGDLSQWMDDEEGGWGEVGSTVELTFAEESVIVFESPEVQAPAMAAGDAAHQFDALDALSGSRGRGAHDRQVAALQEKKRKDPLPLGRKGRWGLLSQHSLHMGGAAVKKTPANESAREASIEEDGGGGGVGERRHLAQGRVHAVQQEDAFSAAQYSQLYEEAQAAALKLEKQGPCHLATRAREAGRILWWVAVTLAASVLLRAIATLALSRVRSANSGNGGARKSSSLRGSHLAAPRLELFLLALAVPPVCLAASILIAGGSVGEIIGGLLLLLLVVPAALLSTWAAWARTRQQPAVASGTPPASDQLQDTAAAGGSSSPQPSPAQGSFWAQHNPARAANWQAVNSGGGSSLLAARWGILFESYRRTAAAPGGNQELVGSGSANGHGGASAHGLAEEEGLGAQSGAAEGALTSLKGAGDRAALAHAAYAVAYRAAVGVLLGAFARSATSSYTQASLLLGLSGLQLLPLAALRLHRSRVQQLVEALSIACETGVFTCCLALVAAGREGQDPSGPGAVALALLLVSFVGQLAGQWGAYYRQVVVLSPAGTPPTFSRGLLELGRAGGALLGGAISCCCCCRTRAARLASKRTSPEKKGDGDGADSGKEEELAAAAGNGDGGATEAASEQQGHLSTPQPTSSNTRRGSSARVSDEDVARMWTAGGGRGSGGSSAGQEQQADGGHVGGEGHKERAVATAVAAGTAVSTPLLRKHGIAAWFSRGGRGTAGKQQRAGAGGGDSTPDASAAAADSPIGCLSFAPPLSASKSVRKRRVALWNPLYCASPSSPCTRAQALRGEALSEAGSSGGSGSILPGSPPAPPSRSPPPRPLPALVDRGHLAAWIGRPKEGAGARAGATITSQGVDGGRGRAWAAVGSAALDKTTPAGDVYTTKSDPEPQCSGVSAAESHGSSGRAASCGAEVQGRPAGSRPPSWESTEESSSYSTPQKAGGGARLVASQESFVDDLAALQEPQSIHLAASASPEVLLRRHSKEAAAMVGAGSPSQREGILAGGGSFLGRGEGEANSWQLQSEQMPDLPLMVKAQPEGARALQSQSEPALPKNEPVAGSGAGEGAGPGGAGERTGAEAKANAEPEGSSGEKVPMPLVHKDGAGFKEAQQGTPAVSASWEGPVVTASGDSGDGSSGSASVSGATDSGFSGTAFYADITSRDIASRAISRDGVAAEPSSRGSGGGGGGMNGVFGGSNGGIGGGVFRFASPRFGPEPGLISAGGGAGWPRRAAPLGGGGRQEEEEEDEEEVVEDEDLAEYIPEHLRRLREELEKKSSGKFNVNDYMPANLRVRSRSSSSVAALDGEAMLGASPVSHEISLDKTPPPPTRSSAKEESRNRGGGGGGVVEAAAAAGAAADKASPPPGQRRFSGWPRGLFGF